MREEYVRGIERVRQRKRDKKEGGFRGGNEGWMEGRQKRPLSVSVSVTYKNLTPVCNDSLSMNSLTIE